MRKGYIWNRLLRSLVSILIIMLIVFTMVYTLVPRDNIFFEDSTYRKLGGKSDDKTEYVYSTWQKLGYLDYVRINDAKWSYPATARTRLYLAAALAALCAAMLYPLTQPGAPSAWAALAGVLLMSGVLVIACCDWRAMTIPYQLCALAALPSIALALLTWGPSGFPTAAGWAVGITAIVWLLAKILGWFGLKGAIGSGDLRLMPWLCLPCGLIGSFCGLAACCAAMGAMGAGMWALRLVNRKSRLPMAPGLCVWLAVGYTTGQVMPGILGMGA